MGRETERGGISMKNLNTKSCFAFRWARLETRKRERKIPIVISSQDNLLYFSAFLALRAAVLFTRIFAIQRCPIHTEMFNQL